MNKTIYILNYWFSNNYGAILTCYALQTFLNFMDYTTLIINYRPKGYPVRVSQDFAEKYLKITEEKNSPEDLQRLEPASTYIVGSDQVWRHKYAWHKDKTIWWLDFVSLAHKKIACAASFGQDYFEGSPDDLERVKYFMQRFDHISVREHSGVDLCRTLFNVNAVQILDPVFWLQQSDWDILVKNATTNTSNFLAAYILDSSDKTTQFISDTQANLKLENSVIISNPRLLENRFLSVENFLFYVKNCEFLITDSFHGMCFAIIFNKPFVCICNRQRGEARFTSLLKTLNLSQYCVDQENLKSITVSPTFFNIENYITANAILSQERKRSISWIKSALEAPKSKVSPHEQKLDDMIRHLISRGDSLESHLIALEQKISALQNITPDSSLEK